MGLLIRLRAPWWVMLLCLWLPACGLPHIRPVAPDRQSEISGRCQGVFLQAPWQMVHSIRTILPGGDQQSAVAVIQVYPDAGLIRCVTMSIEGIVLFEGEYSFRDEGPGSGRLTVNRAIPPFDEENFARTMFSDIRLAFCPPAAHAVGRVGSLPDGVPGCRYQAKDDGFVEVALKAEGKWAIRRYSRHGRKQQSIQAHHPPSGNENRSGAAQKIPATLEILHHGLFGYSLKLELIRAKPLPPGKPR